MSETDSFSTSFAVRVARESWVWYGMGALLLVLRIITKLRYAAVRRLGPEDAVALVAFVCYTGAVVSLNYITGSGGSNLIDPDSVDQVDPSEIDAIIFNSKIVLISEQAYINTLYACKICVLLFFRKVTNGLATQKAVNMVAIAVLCGWVATQIAMFTACHPFDQYWALFPTNDQCVTFKIYGIVQQSMNLPTDLAMLIITFPIVIKLQLGIRQKILIGGLFSLGIFVVLMAVLNVAFTNTDYYSSGYILWYIREISVAFYVAMLPHIWPLLMAIFPTLTRTVNYSRNFYANTKSKKEGSRTGGTNNILSQNSTKAQATVMGSNTTAVGIDGTVNKADSMEELEKMYGVKVVSEIKIERSSKVTEMPQAGDQV